MYLYVFFFNQMLTKSVTPQQFKAPVSELEISLAWQNLNWMSVSMAHNFLAKVEAIKESVHKIKI